MSNRKQKFISSACVIVLLGNTLVAFGQQGTTSQPAPKEEHQIFIEHSAVIETRTEQDGQVGGTIMRRSTMPGQQTVTVLPGQGGDVKTFGFISSEMGFDSKVVKGAPYTADAIQEQIQVLGDGNRIVNRSTSSIARDSEGRTRREQAVTLVGPWAGDGQTPKTIFINDPVANVNYVLDPRSKTANKLEFKVRFGDKIHSFGGKTLDGVVEEKATRISGVNSKDTVIKRVQPVYPAIAKAAGVEGTVKVNVLVSESGNVVSAEVLDGPQLLRDAALDAARQWQYKPAEVDGKPVKVKGVATFNFTLDKPTQAPKAPTANAVTLAAPAIETTSQAPAVVTIPPMATTELAYAQNSSGVTFMRMGTTSKHEVKTEDLGKQTIEGVVCEGKRTTMTIPAGEIGNERPIETISEHWYSPELQVTVMTKTSDPRFGETSYRLQNIIRNEPSPSLFQIPSDYTVNEGPAFLPGVAPAMPGGFGYRFERRGSEKEKN